MKGFLVLNFMFDLIKGPFRDIYPCFLLKQILGFWPGFLQKDAERRLEALSCLACAGCYAYFATASDNVVPR